MGTNIRPEVENVLRTIFKRCVQCEPGTPSCPTCPRGQICSLVPQSCNDCARMTCIPNPSPPPNPGGPNVGAIAGGVVAGVVAIGVAVSLLWYFWIRKRRAEQEQDLAEWEDEFAQQKLRRQQAGDLASTRTRQSFANSIISRASNIIQIAYIPGVTNRNGDSGRTSVLNNTPVPPIPAAFRDGDTSSTPKSPLSGNGDALFFRPDDLRGSTYSTNSSIRSSDRDTRYTRQSITPSLARSSIVSAIYRDDATAEPMPATTGMMVIPRMVSVKSNNSHTPSPLAESTKSPSGQNLLVPGQSARGQASPITLGSEKPKQLYNRPTMTAQDLMDPSDDDTLTDLPDFQTLTSRNYVSNPFADPSPAGAKSQPASPYAMMSANVSQSAPTVTHTESVEERAKRVQVGKLTSVIEEGVKRASHVPERKAAAGKATTESPFGDEHATD